MNKRFIKKCFATFLCMAMVLGLVPTAISADETVSKASSSYSSAKSVTVMIYVIGSDLESQSGLATTDMLEMKKANTSSKVNVILETGGTKKWKNASKLGVSISANSNQRYKISGGKVSKVYDAGKRKTMTSADTLSDFVTWTAKNYPADRYELILWDHGGGTIDGYGVDQFNESETLTADEIDSALDKSGVKFDWIGFDACLMATVENGLTLAEHADYLIASEESETGTGWYYTNWLKQLSNNPAIDSVKLGTTIVNDFISYSKKDDPQSPATLSMVDLSELTSKVKPKMETLGTALSKTLSGGNYTTVSKARKNSKYYYEKKLDLIDLQDFCKQLGTTEAKNLKKALTSAVKVNNTYNIKNSNGIACYIPYYKIGKYNSSYKVLKKLSISSKNLKFINDFATLVSGGQISDGDEDSNSSDDWDDGSDDDWNDSDWGSSDWDDWDYDDWDNWNDWDDDWGYDDWGYDSWDYWSMGSRVGLDECESWYKGEVELTSADSLIAKLTATNLSASDTTITLNLEKISTTVGKKVQLTYTLKPKNSKETVTFKSSNPDVASVSKNGVVIANKQGKAIIAAMVDGSKQVAECKIVVKAGKSVYDSMTENEWFNEELATAFTNFYSKNAVTDDLYLTKKGSGKNKYFVLDLEEKDWDLITDAQLQVLKKDKKGGYYLLGSDSYYEEDDNGDLKVAYNEDYTWWSIDGRLVNYVTVSYEESGKNKWCETGEILAKVNGQSGKIITKFDESHDNPYVVGFRVEYENGNVSKGLQKIKKGDTIQYMTYYYDSEGNESIKRLSKAYTLEKSMSKMIMDYKFIGNADSEVRYMLTDIYNNNYWTESIVYES